MFEPIAPTLAPEETVGHRDLGGLLGLAAGCEVAFPLREMRVRASVAGNCCRTIVEQVFDNPYKEGLEAVHIFPLPPDGAVTELELISGDVVVRGDCREREAAERAFDQARSRGQRAALLTAERADVHTVRVTNIPPGTGVRVRLVVIERLEEADGAFVWRFPTVLAPRYLPGSPTDHTGSGVIPDTDRVPDASRLQPPLRLTGGVTLDLELQIAGPLASLESSLHAVRASLGDQVRVAPSGRATLDRDFVLRFTPAAPSGVPVRGYTDGLFTLALVNPPELVETSRVPRDVVLVIDVSGSMGGEKLDAAKKALSAALHGLERGDRFRLIAFESSVHKHSRDLVAFDETSLHKADRWIAHLHPMGGTEMLPALREAFSGTTPPGRLRTVVFITDGQAWNEPELVAAVERDRAGALLFTVGIDTAVNESLLKRLARVGGGTCELVTPRDDIEEAIVRLEARLGAPVLTGLVPRHLEAARPEPTHVFAGRPSVLLLRGTADRVVFEGTDSAGQPTELVAESCQRITFPLGALWARERVAWLEDRILLEPEREKKLRSEILALALEHHIASRFTALVAVEERVSHTGERVSVVQPVELPDSWSEAFRVADLAAMPAAAQIRGAALSASHLSMLGLFGGPARLAPGTRQGAPFSAGTDEALEPDETAAATSAFDFAAVGRPGALFADTERKAVDPLRVIESSLATTQGADGSFEGSVERTAAALVTLVRLGHTRRKGTRRRVVQKAARWLEQHGDDALARLALEMLGRAEAGGGLPQRSEVEPLLGVTPEGAALNRALQASG